MGNVIADMPMSLDGFIAGPNDGVALPLGAGCDRLHRWVYDLASWRERHGLEGGQTTRDAEVLDEAFTNTAAAVMGRRMFDLGERPWGENPPFHMPVFEALRAARGRAALRVARDGAARPAHAAANPQEQARFPQG